jgi:FKBP-type peptidyl-prolyl cis-trans isomerase FklB
MFILVLVSHAEAKIDKNDPESMVSYSLGLSIGDNFRNDLIKINTESFIEGLNDGLQSISQLSEAEIKKVLADFQKTQMTLIEEKNKQESAENLKKGQAFLEKNKKKKGIVVTESGLQYKILKQGKGTSPGPVDKVKVHYKGTLIEGTEFDSSYTRGTPAEFKVNQVISGWTEALQLMKPGSKWELFIPANLGYGERGTGRSIGPNEVLIFEVELLEILETDNS